MLVVVLSEEFTAEAKEVLPAIRPLNMNEAIQINIERYICFSAFHWDRKEATTMPAFIRTNFQSLIEIQQAATTLLQARSRHEKYPAVKEMRETV